MRVNGFIAAAVLAGCAATGYVMPDYISPLDVKAAVEERIQIQQFVNRARKSDRLRIVSSATFDQRWNGLDAVDRSKMPALDAWLREHSAAGLTVANGENK